jgi:hypothetical protein
VGHIPTVVHVPVVDGTHTRGGMRPSWRLDAYRSWYMSPVGMGRVPVMVRVPCGGGGQCAPLGTRAGGSSG